LYYEARKWNITLRNVSNVALSETWTSLAGYTISMQNLASSLSEARTIRNEHTGTGPIYFCSFKTYVIGREEPRGVILKAPSC